MSGGTATATGSGLGVLNRRVRVVVRTRPTANFAHDLIQLEEDGKTVSIHLPKNEDQLKGFINNRQQDWSFPLDRVLHNASQDEVYDYCAQEITSRLLEGYNGTIMAYGETGAGKTYTMSGATENYRLRGIIPRAISQVFQEVRERSETSIFVRISYLEIYNEVMYDLLSTLPESSSTKTPTSPLHIAEDDQGSVTVKGLTTRLANNEEEALNMLFEGNMNRVIAEHTLNTHSSRSHCIFTIHVESHSRTHSNAEYSLSKLNLVDLAGSERLSKTNSSGVTQKEAMHINKSLSFLEQVIIALADRRRDHIPYRQSRLTHVLRDSLGGNCHTLMVANIWAEASQIEETISTLRFATRMMCVSNKPVQNILHDPQLLVKQYEQEIKALKLELAMHDTLASRGTVSYDPLGEGQVAEIQRQVQQYVDGTLPEIEIVNVRQIREVLVQFKRLTHSLPQSLPAVDMEEVRQRPPSPATTATTSTTTSKQPTSQKTKGKHLVPPPDQEGDHLVGDTDGTGFGIGVAPSSMKHVASSVAATKKFRAVTKQASEVRKKESKPSITKSSESPLMAQSEAKEEGREQKSPTESVAGTRPSTPPPRSEAFEQFKRERGSEINKILVLNKESLHKKCKVALELSTTINTIKRKMDQLCLFLDEKQCGEEGRVVVVRSEGGEEVLQEEDYQAITELKQLKSQYREQHASLLKVQAEVQYCRQYVDQCRTRLLAEFDAWYKLAFLGDGGEVGGGKEEEKVSPECERDKFDRLQAALLRNDPATIAFYNAQLRTERRVYELGSVRRRPGQVTSSVRNRPPGLMAFN